MWRDAGKGPAITEPLGAFDVISSSEGMTSSMQGHQLKRSNIASKTTLSSRILLGAFSLCRSRGLLSLAGGALCNYICNTDTGYGVNLNFSFMEKCAVIASPPHFFKCQNARPSCFASSPRRPYVEYKRMVLEHTHGLFIT